MSQHSEHENEYVLGSADSTPPSRWINGNGYAYYQVGLDGVRYTVQEHQLIALLDGADPEKLFSDGAFHVHHETNTRCGVRDTGEDVEALRRSEAAALAKQVNYAENLRVVESEWHGQYTNGDGE